ncbi:MAG: SHOCT domain-containing protein [Chloroflexota bacterium]
MMFIGALILIVLAVLFARTVGQGVGTTEPSSTSGRSLDILRQRYARGEISREEYEQMRRDLSD